MMAWMPARSGWGALDLTLPDGSAVRFHPGSLLGFTTQARLTSAGVEYRLAWWKVWRGDEHVLTVRPAGWRQKWRGLQDTLAALWRAARGGRYDLPLPFVERARVSVVGSDDGWVLSQQDRLFVAAAGGPEVLAVRAGRRGPPHEVRAGGPLAEPDMPLLLVLTYLAVGTDD